MSYGRPEDYGGGPREPELGSGGFFGRYGDYGPRGPYGAWPGCGCGTLIMILGGMILVCGGFLSYLESMFRRF
jgi:hypothetical protein